MNQPFSIFLELSTPLVMGRRLHLDALLAFMLYDRYINDGMDDNEAIERSGTDVPLSQIDDVYCGSGIILPRCPTSTLFLTGSLERHIVNIPNVENLLAHNTPNRKGARRFPPLRSAYKPSFSDLRVFDLTGDGMGVFFAGHGDLDAVRDLLGEVDSIGSKRNVGYGRVKRITCNALSGGDDWTGMLTKDGSVLRPIPKTIADGWKKAIRHSKIADESFRPPYWGSPRVLCYVPREEFWSFSAAQAQFGGNR